MKYLSLVALLLLAMFTGVARAADDGQAVQAQVRGFYHWYVHAINKDIQAEPRKSAEIHRYISERFLKEIARQEKTEHGLEVDPFLCGQDWDKDWEKNIGCKEMKRAGSKWMVLVELTGKEMGAHRLKLALVKEGGAWKIDQASDADARPEAH